MGPKVLPLLRSQFIRVHVGGTSGIFFRWCQSDKMNFHVMLEYVVCCLRYGLSDFPLFTIHDEPSSYYSAEIEGTVKI